MGYARFKSEGSEKKRRFTPGPPPSTNRGWRRFYALNPEERKVRSNRWESTPNNVPSQKDCQFN